MSVCCFSVQPFAWSNSAPTGWIFMKFYILHIFQICQEIQISLKSDNNDRCQYTSLIMSHQILLKMGSVSDKSCRENQHTHFVFNNSPPQNAVCDVEPDKLQMTIWCMNIACWIPNARSTHSEYVICFSTATKVA